MANNWAGWDDLKGGSSSSEQNESKQSNGSSGDSTSNKQRDRVKEEPPHSDADLGEAPEFPPIFFRSIINFKLEIKEEMSSRSLR